MDFLRSLCGCLHRVSADNVLLLADLGLDFWELTIVKMYISRVLRRYRWLPHELTTWRFPEFGLLVSRLSGFALYSSGANETKRPE